MVQLFTPVFMCVLGLYFVFIRFWHGFDAVSGDLGDARFNAYVLEHTWLWAKGVHGSLFNMPMFYPHENVYAYSDFMLGAAPLYWFFRAVGCDMMLSYQWWMVACSALNFTVFHSFLKKVFNLNCFFAALGAYVFAFSLPRITHLEHVQLVGQFFIVMSALGLWMWWKDPQSKKAPWLFCTGAILQFISAFYFFWFWVWTLAIYLAYLVWNRTRRTQLWDWTKSIPRKNLVAPFVINGIIAIPFLYHYALAAKYFGRRDWVSISNSVPRIYSWINLPKDHWEWSWLPVKNWILALPMIHEHYLSFGLLTWIAMIYACVWIYRHRPDFKFLLIPLAAMFIFTITSGRFSTWVFMAYLFPGGGAIRAMSRIQIFMLLFWSPILMLFLMELWRTGKKWIVSLIVIAFFAENIYVSDWVYSRSKDQARLDQVAKMIPADCEVMVNPKGFAPFADEVNIDTVMIAFQNHRSTMNGYSGHEPHDYLDTMKLVPEVSKTKKVCMIGEGP